jgi:hypothetical protein
MNGAPALLKRSWPGSTSMPAAHGRITGASVAAPGPELDLSQDEVAGRADAGRPAGDPVVPNHDGFISTRG